MKLIISNNLDIRKWTIGEYNRFLIHGLRKTTNHKNKEIDNDKSKNNFYFNDENNLKKFKTNFENFKPLKKSHKKENRISVLGFVFTMKILNDNNEIINDFKSQELKKFINNFVEKWNENILKKSIPNHDLLGYQIHYDELSLNIHLQYSNFDNGNNLLENTKTQNKAWIQNIKDNEKKYLNSINNQIEIFDNQKIVINYLNTIDEFKLTKSEKNNALKFLNLSKKQIKEIEEYKRTINSIKNYALINRINNSFKEGENFNFLKEYLENIKNEIHSLLTGSQIYKEKKQYENSIKTNKLSKNSKTL